MTVRDAVSCVPARGSRVDNSIEFADPAGITIEDGIADASWGTYLLASLTFADGTSRYEIRPCFFQPVRRSHVVGRRTSNGS